MRNHFKLNRPFNLRTAAVVLLACLLSAPLQAKIYKWQDEDGNWHYSDRPPQNDLPVETVVTSPPPPPSQLSDRVTERRGGEPYQPEHFFFNHYHGPAQIELRLAENTNALPDPALPSRFVLPAQAERRLVTFGPDIFGEGFSYRLSYTLVPGEPLFDLPKDLTYYPPFARKQAFPISQGLDDSHTHKDAANRYAVDIAMPMGTPVLAARGGVVMDMESSFRDKGKQEAAYLPKANYIRMLHDDGSMAIYAHLKANTIRVKPGMRVPRGHWIADSGNSGFSSGPHLHFVVQINIGMALESLPFSFKLPSGGVMDPDRTQMLEGVILGPTR